MFNSVKEFAYALLEGREFTNSDDAVNAPRQGERYIFKNGFKAKPKDYNGYLIMDAYDWSRYSRVTEVIEPKWYEKIPEQGVLCWVWDDGMDICKQPSALKLITGIVGKKEHRLRFYDAIGDTWDYAQPLTKVELMQFIDQGNEE